MNSTGKKLIAAATLVAFTVLGTGIPAEAAPMKPSRTIWCC
jgi:hypothetical protein